MEMKIGENRLSILLKPTTNIPGMNTPCLFEGKVEEEEAALAAVIGCHNSSKTLLTISSSQVPGGILDLSLIDGITYNIALNNGTVFHGQRRKRGADSEKDYLVPPKNPLQGSIAPFQEALPSRVTLKTDIKYDNSLLKHFGYSHEKTKEFLNRVVSLAKVWMSHESIVMKVDIKVGEVDHIDETIRASGYHIRNLFHRGFPSHTSFFCKDFTRGSTLGIAYVRSACDYRGYAININELYTRYDAEQSTAKVFAHELGHNIGMLHDFEDVHGGHGGPCDGRGLMSYHGAKDKWSACSNDDFEAYWRREGYRCMN